MSLRELSNVTKQAELSDEQVKALKLIRKRLKNRISAREHAKKQQQQVGEARMGSQILQQNQVLMQDQQMRLQEIVQQTKHQRVRYLRCCNSSTPYPRACCHQTPHATRHTSHGLCRALRRLQSSFNTYELIWCGVVVLFLAGCVCR